MRKQDMLTFLLTYCQITRLLSHESQNSELLEASPSLSDEDRVPETPPSRETDLNDSVEYPITAGKPQVIRFLAKECLMMLSHLTS